MKSHVEQRESMQQQAEPEMHDSCDAALYDRYARIILAYVRLHTDLREDPEDLTLEVFLAALERDNLPALAEDELAPEQVALRHEEHAHLQVAIKRLSGPQQQLLQLRYGHGLRFAEIAILLNKREVALRKLLSRTLTFLRATYDQ